MKMHNPTHLIMRLWVVSVRAKFDYGNPDPGDDKRLCPFHEHCSPFARVENLPRCCGN